jgi:hypothetical protein
MNITRLYAWLLRLYPRQFYTRFSDEMLDVFTQALENKPTGRLSSLAFCTREFSGLLASIIRERQEAYGMYGLRNLFRRRYVPVWLFVFSLLAAAVFSQNYWGYPVAPPPSRISNLATIERISLVKFDADNNISVIPIKDLPSANIPDFPPSNILPSIPADVQIDRTLDPAFTAMLSAALAREQIEINGPRTDYPVEPVIEANGSFMTGVQPQDDGSLLVIYPEISRDGRVEEEHFIQRLTPSDSHYYYFYTMPAGYIVQGQDRQGQPLVFAAIANCVGGDRYIYHELTFVYGTDGLILRDRLNYNFDIAGLEGIASMPVVTLAVFIPLLGVWLAILAVGALIHWAGRRMSYRQSII